MFEFLTTNPLKWLQKYILTLIQTQNDIFQFPKQSTESPTVCAAKKQSFYSTIPPQINNMSSNARKRSSGFFLFVFFNSVLHAFQDYFSSYETGQSVGGRKREDPKKNHLAHPQAELGLSHMWSERGSNPHQTQQ